MEIRETPGVAAKASFLAVNADNTPMRESVDLTGGGQLPAASPLAGNPRALKVLCYSSSIESREERKLKLTLILVVATS